MGDIFKIDVFKIDIYKVCVVLELIFLREDICYCEYFYKECIVLFKG